MTQLKNNSYYKDLASNEHFKGQIDKVPDEFNSLKVSVQTNQSGTLTIFHSVDGVTWSNYGDVFTITTDSHKQVTLKGKYLYVSYLNGATATTNNFNLVSYLSKAIHNNIDVKLTTEDQVSVVPVGGAMDVNVVNSVEIQGLNFTEQGALIVSGGGCGGSGGDASASNQLTQITIAETLNDDTAIIKTESQAQTTLQEAMNLKLEELDLIEQHLDTKLIKCDTDNIAGVVTIDDSNPVNVVGLAKVYNTLNNTYLTTDADQSLRVNVVNQISNITGFALESTLNDTKTIQEQIGEELITFRSEQLPLQHEQAYVDLLVEGPTMWADTVPAFTTHPSQKGWYWTNSTPSRASNIYFYANTQAKQTQYTISQVMNSYAVVKIADLTGTSSLPFLNVYSRPQGAGDHVPGFYRSAWVYTIPNTAQLSQIGNEFLLYWGELPSIKIHPTLRRVQATLAFTRGPALQTETLQFLTVNTDSGAPVNTVDVIYSYLGYTTYGGLVHDIELGYGNQDTTRQLTSKLNTLSLESTQQQLKTQLDKLTFTGSNLLVSSSGSSNLKCNDVLLSQTPDGTKNCLDVQVNNNISGFATESTLNTILEVLGDNVPVINYGLLNDTPQYIPIKANADGEMLVNVQNQVDISPIATETTLSALSTLVTNQSAYSRFQTEAPVSDGKLDTIISNMSLTNFNVNNLTKCDTDNVAIPTGVSINTLPSITGTVSVDNFPGNFQISGPVSIDNYPVTQAVSISTAVPVINDTNTALDVHCYGVGSGNSMHRMSVDSQGKQNINLHDDQGNGISSSTNGTSRGLDVVVKGDVNANIATSANGSLTSTSVTGTETYNALHVLTKGTTSVSGSVKTQAQDNNTNRVANNVSVVAPVQIGTSNDTEGYLWVSAIFSFASVSSGGTIYLEVSHDGSFWARPSSASTFVMSSMANVYGSIILTTPCPFRYVRLYAEAPFSGLGCSAWFVMK